MSAKTLAILEELHELSPTELRELCQQINRLVAVAEKAASPASGVSDDEFESALNEVTGCTAGSKSLQRLLNDRRRDRERDEAMLETRKQERVRG